MKEQKDKSKPSKGKRGPAKGQGGRPPEGTVRLALKVQPDIETLIRHGSAAGGLTMSDWVSRAVTAFAHTSTKA